MTVYGKKKFGGKKGWSLQKLKGKEEKSGPELSCFRFAWNAGVIKPLVT